MDDPNRGCGRLRHHSRYLGVAPWVYRRAFQHACSERSPGQSSARPGFDLVGAIGIARRSGRNAALLNAIDNNDGGHR